MKQFQLVSRSSSFSDYSLALSLSLFTLGDFSKLSQTFQSEQLFNLTSSSSSTDALIRSGLLTPFGTTPTLPTNQPHDIHTTKRISSSPVVALADFDWLGPSNDDTDQLKNDVSKRTNREGASQATSSSKTLIDNEVENESRLLALKNEDTRESREESTSNRVGPATSSRGEDESEDSSYTTDEELGASKKRRKRAIDEDESEDELVQVNWHGKKKKRNGGGVRTKGDDGDDGVYKARMR